MTDEQIILIQQSWDELKPEARQIGRSMYDKLFIALPHVRQMFKEDVNEQACKLAAVVTFVVSKLHRFSDIFPDLRSIGEKHKGYHIPEAWYDVVGNCLVDSIKEGTGSGWNQQKEDAWLALYAELKKRVQEGQQSQISS
jgi:hemoglobin-like flavoprotein